MVWLALFSWVLLREQRLFPSTESLAEQLSKHDPALFWGPPDSEKIEEKIIEPWEQKGQYDYGG